MTLLSSFCLKGPVLVGNWKMNGVRQSIDNFFFAIKHRYPVYNIMAFPDVYLDYSRGFLQRATSFQTGDCEVLGTELGQYSLAGQTCAPYEKGAHTGCVSAAMLADVGCTYVILGHPERRGHESAKEVRQSAMCALKCGLGVIICLTNLDGDLECVPTLPAFSFLSEVQGANNDNKDCAFVATAGPHEQSPMERGQFPRPVWPILIAYEPCVGADSPAQGLEQASIFLRNTLPHPILYGGGITETSICSLKQFFHGFLVGRASLEATQWQEIQRLLSLS